MGERGARQSARCLGATVKFIIIPTLKPSFRRKPESMIATAIAVAADYDAGFRRKPE